MSLNLPELPENPEVASDETPLTGGNVNAAVVRVDKTVRRVPTAASPAVQGLLQHLEKAGFAGAPRFLGVDDQGREILTFLPGEAGFLPYLWEGEAPLLAAAHLLRAYHDASQDYIPPPGAAFAYTYPDPERHETICHNDFAPYNLICDPQQRVPYAIIDFDMAGPGPRLRDIAYAAYWLVPLAFGNSDFEIAAQADLLAGSPRLQRFCNAYGITPNPDLPKMLDEVLQFLADWLEEGVRAEQEVQIRMVAEGHLDQWKRARAAYQAHIPALQANLIAAYGRTL